MGDPGGSGIGADEDVRAVVVFPQMPHLDPVQGDRPAKRLQQLADDDGASLLMRLFCRPCLLSALLFGIVFSAVRLGCLVVRGSHPPSHPGYASPPSSCHGSTS